MILSCYENMSLRGGPKALRGNPDEKYLSGLLRFAGSEARNDERRVNEKKNAGRADSLPDFICAGIITSAHGVQGHVKIRCFLEDPRTLESYSPLYNEQGEPVYKIKKVLSQHHGMMIVALEGISNRTTAEFLKGVRLMLPRERLPALPEDTFYYTDLEGLSVLSFDGEEVGKIHALYNFGAGDLIEIKTLKGKLCMVPFTHATTLEVDMERNSLRLNKEGEAFLTGSEDDA